MASVYALHPQYVDDKRLLREHQTLHKVMNELAGRKNSRTRHRFYNYAGYIALRHYLDASELRLRNMNHDSFVDRLWKQIPDIRKNILFIYKPAEIVRDMKLLRAKQLNSSGTASRGRVEIPTDRVPVELNELAEKYNTNGLPKDCFLV